MGNLAIKVENLGKMYHIGGPQEAYSTFRDAITRTVSAPFKRTYDLLRGQAYGAAGLKEEIWALKDVSFEVKHGEVVGIIGHNGAGKSTLLKILSRITEPTAGYADIYGRVGALLEVGTGFHPELTGRENVYLNGAILGMSRNDINLKFNEIVEFAGVEKFIDTPVKHYSSGMGLRLGFSVAAHLEPEILVVDEVLAVGDAQFQKKCLGKMSDVASEGRTVLFVSHNMGAVQSLCQRCIWLNEGVVVDEGQTEHIVSSYLNSSISAAMDQSYEDIQTAPGNDRIRVKRVRVIPSEGDTNKPITMVTPLKLEFEYWNLKPDTYLNLSLYVYSPDGALAFNTAPVHDAEWLTKPYPQGLFRSVCYVPGYLLNSGIYHVKVLFVEDQARIICQLDDVLVFDVAEAPEARGVATWFGRWPGSVHPKLEWKTKELFLHNNID
ncbi:MAG: ABC transporter ATP-binding protein [Chloroflexi bacterium]|nr:ABC transporter ATP-binding protein [Chloroflexota bacterium]